MKGLMLTIAFAAALAAPAVAQSQWREGPFPLDVQDIKAAGLMPYEEPILPGNWCTTLNRYPGRPDANPQMVRPGRGVATLCQDRLSATASGRCSQAVGVAGCLAAQLSADKVRMAAENADRARERAFDAKRKLHDMGVE